MENRIKTLIEHLISENDSLIERIKRRKQDEFFEIDICANSYSHFSNNVVTLDLTSLQKIKEIAMNVVGKNKIDTSVFYSVDDTLEYNNIVSSINVKDGSTGFRYVNSDGSPRKTLTEMFEDIQINEDNTFNTILLFSLMFILYHEIGHFVVNEETFDELKREYKADEFSIEYMKEFDRIHSFKYRELIYVGYYVAIVLMLYEADIKNDSNHPHPIERLYLFLSSIDIDEDHYLWEEAYKEITRWCECKGDQIICFSGQQTYKTLVCEYNRILFHNKA